MSLNESASRVKWRGKARERERETRVVVRLFSTLEQQPGLVFIIIMIVHLAAHEKKLQLDEFENFLKYTHFDVRKSSIDGLLMVTK